MIEIEITYKGKKYKDLTNAVTVAAIDGIKEYVEKTLQPFKSEIDQHGGKVTVDIPKKLKDMNVSVENVPQELIDRITKAFE